MNHSASPIPFIVRPLVFAACLVVQTAVGENLLRNGAFAEPVSDANPLPLNWHVAPQDSAEVSLARGGSDGPVLTATIASTSSSQGQVSQRVATRPNRRLLVTADVRSSVAGASPCSPTPRARPSAGSARSTATPRTATRSGWR